MFRFFSGYRAPDKKKRGKTTRVVMSWKPSGEVMKLPIVKPTAVKPAVAITVVNSPKPFFIYFVALALEILCALTCTQQTWIKYAARIKVKSKYAVTSGRAACEEEITLEFIPDSHNYQWIDSS
jgi:hypothetical protein